MQFTRKNVMFEENSARYTAFANGISCSTTAKINLAAAINTRRIDNKSSRKIRSTDK